MIMFIKVCAHFKAGILARQVILWVSLLALLAGATGSQARTEKALMPFTPPPPQPPSRTFSFIVYGDIQGNHKGAHDALVRHMLQEDAALIFHTGDISPDQGKNYKRHFLPAIEPLAARIPFFPSPGNHDVDWGNPFSRHRFQTCFQRAYHYLAEQPLNPHLRESGSQKLWYGLTFGKALFMVLDSNLFIDTGSYRRTHAFDTYRNYAQEQLAWARNVLEEARRDPEIEARFVFFHHPPFVSDEAEPLPLLGWGGHPHHREMVVNERMPAAATGEEIYLLDLFRLHQVNAIFTGHEHYYERWQEIIRENGRAIHRLNWIVNGLGGVKPRGHPEYEEEEIADLVQKDRVYGPYLDRISRINANWSSELKHLYPTPERREARFANYMLVTVEGPRLSFATKDLSGKIRDQGSF